MAVAEIYDHLAEIYDDRYADDTCLFENAVVASLAAGLTGIDNPRLLDIGCGSGLALELEMTSIENYTGMDPSMGMINRLKEKFPEANAVVATFEDWYQLHWERPPGEPHLQFDLAVSMFGSPSYITPEFIEKILHTAPAVLMMHYKPGYWPDYEDEPVNSPGSRDAAVQACLEAGGRMIWFNNFWVSLIGGES